MAQRKLKHPGYVIVLHGQAIDAAYTRAEINRLFADHIRWWRQGKGNTAVKRAPQKYTLRDHYSKQTEGTVTVWRYSEWAVRHPEQVGTCLTMARLHRTQSGVDSRLAFVWSKAKNLGEDVLAIGWWKAVDRLRETRSALEQEVQGIYKALRPKITYSWE